MSKKKPTWGAECVVGPPKGHHRGTYGGPHEKTMAGGFCLLTTILLLAAPSAAVALIVKVARS